MTLRDQLAMKLLGMRQLIYDAPEHKLSEIEKAVKQFEQYIKNLAAQK